MGRKNSMIPDGQEPFTPWKCFNCDTPIPSTSSRIIVVEAASNDVKKGSRVVARRWFCDYGCVVEFAGRIGLKKTSEETRKLVIRRKR